MQSPKKQLQKTKQNKTQIPFHYFSSSTSQQLKN